MIDTIKTGRIISICRKDSGLTQEELASKLGVTPQAVSRWERGSSVPDVDMLLPLARMFKIAVEALLTGELTPYARESESKSFGVTASSNGPSAADLLTHCELAIRFSEKICVTEDEEFKVFMSGTMNGIAEKRRELARRLGILMPVVNIRDDVALKENEYEIILRNKIKLSGEFHMGMSFAYSDGESFPEAMDGIETVDCFGKKVRWVRNDKIPENYKNKFNPAQNMVIGHLHDAVIKNLRSLVNRDMAKLLADVAAVSFPVTVSETVPAKISYAALAKLLASILDEGKPVNDLQAILEAVDEAENLSNIPALGKEIAKLL